jgi:hypothetical protein
MTKKVLYQQDDGSIALLSPSPDVSIEEAMQNIPKGCQHIIIDESQLPSNEMLGEYFDAMRVNFASGEIFYDLLKAKEITKTRLRRQRIKLFEKNDIAIRDAQIDADLFKLDIAVTERNRLRDITRIADAAMSIEELKSIKL